MDEQIVGEMEDFKAWFYANHADPCPMLLESAMGELRGSYNGSYHMCSSSSVSGGSVRYFMDCDYDGELS